MYYQDDETKIVAIYCRVSTVEQAEEGYSIDEQERLLIEYCERNNYTVYRTYADKGISGKDIEHRPQMKALLSDAMEKKFNMVISWKINRLSRKLEDALKIVSILEKNNIKYRSYSEPFENDTPSGKMQFQMMALVGEFERKTIAQNVKMGMCAKARNGEWCGGRPMLGYDLEKAKDRGEKSRLVVNEEEAQIVRTIFELYAQGNGYKTIVGILNKNGYKTKLGNQFSVAQIKPILTNPAYIGRIRYDVRREWNEKRRGNINPNPIVVEGRHDPIIDIELWDKVQFLLEQSMGMPSRKYAGEYPLTGILKCPECGAGMVLSRVTNTRKDGSKHRITYYACGNWKNKGITACHSNGIRVDKANAYVYTQLERIMTSESFLEGVLERINRENLVKTNTASANLKKYESQVQEIKKRKQKSYAAFEDGILSSEEFLERKRQLDDDLEIILNLQKEAQEITSNSVTNEISNDVVKEILQNFSKVLSSDIDRTLRKKLLHLLISEITIDKDRQIDSIKIKLTDELIQFLHYNGGVLKDTSLFFYVKDLGLRYMDVAFSI